jgi:hypothetical protein
MRARCQLRLFILLAGGTALGLSCSIKPSPPKPTVVTFGTTSMATCMTIDATKEKALNCMRKLYPNQPAHLTTVEAAKNLEECTDTEETASIPLTIIGHGISGYLITGGGRGFGDPDKYVGYPDAADQYWQPPFKDLGTSSGRDGLITLLSCHTGARDGGAELLFKIAKHLDRPVRARTGFTYCKDSGLSFEPASEWQEVDPNATQPPAAINPPKRPSRTPSGAVKLSGGPVLDIGQITSLEIKNRLLEESPWKKVFRDTVFQLVQHVEFDQPDFPGEPLAVETARVRITFEAFGTREFIVYNDSLLQDTVELGAVYYTQPQFMETLNELLGAERTHDLLGAIRRPAFPD